MYVFKSSGLKPSARQVLQIQADIFQGFLVIRSVFFMLRNSNKYAKRIIKIFLKISLEYLLLKNSSKYFIDFNRFLFRISTAQSQLNGSWLAFSWF